MPLVACEPFRLALALRLSARSQLIALAIPVLVRRCSTPALTPPARSRLAGTSFTRNQYVHLDGGPQLALPCPQRRRDPSSIPPLGTERFLAGAMALAEPVPTSVLAAAEPAAEPAAVHAASLAATLISTPPPWP